MKVTALTVIIFQVNGLVDSGESIPIHDVEDALEQRNVLGLLENHHPDRVDFSLHKKHGLRDEIEHHLSDYGLASPSEDWRVRDNGLCWIIALLTEVIQSEWDNFEPRH